MVASTDVLKESLDNLSSRKHVISDEAVHAKRHLEEEQRASQLELAQNVEKQQDLLKEFNVSIKLLTKIFQQSKFDSILGLAVNPTRMLVLNFCIGIFRGFGFCVGALIFASLFLYFFADIVLALF